MQRAESLADAAKAFADRLGGDQVGLGRRLAQELIDTNEQLRSIKNNVDRELARGGRSAKGAFRL